MSIVLNLTLEEVNVILVALSNGAYKQVVGVIQKVEDQAKAQLPTMASVSEQNAEGMQ